MGTILGAGVPDEEDDFLGIGGADTEAGSRQAADDLPVSWEENPERVGVAFNLSKQLSMELDRIRHELEEDRHPSKSEIAEVALRIAVEDFWSSGRESELVRRIEERHASRFDRRQAFGSVPDDEDRDLGHLLRVSTAGSQGSADVGERLAGLGRQVAGTDEAALGVIGDLAGDEDQPAAGRGDDMGVRLGGRQVIGIDAFERHYPAGTQPPSTWITWPLM